VSHGGSVAVTPSSACKWCPAKANCPAFAGITRELLAPGNDWLDKARTAIESDDNLAAELWLKVSRARELLQTLQGLLDARAVERPFALPDGSVVREVETKKDAVKNARVVRDVLSELFGAEVANAAVETELHTTKGAIEKAVAEAVPKGDGTKEKKRVLAVLKERGGIETRTGKTVAVTEPKKVSAA
jgi:hypothetical protein